MINCKGFLILSEQVRVTLKILQKFASCKPRFWEHSIIQIKLPNCSNYFINPLAFYSKTFIKYSRLFEYQDFEFLMFAVLWLKIQLKFLLVNVSNAEQKRMLLH